MRRVTENYSIEEAAGGYVVRHDLGRHAEYLGTDGLWHRDARHADPFPERHYAEQKIEQERGDRA
jgi:hypothetical protein